MLMQSELRGRVVRRDDFGAIRFVAGADMAISRDGKRGVKPIYVSIGHRVSLKSAIRIVLNCSDGLRIPRPTREADHYVAAFKRI